MEANKWVLYVITDKSVPVDGVDHVVYVGYTNAYRRRQVELRRGYRCGAGITDWLNSVGDRAEFKVWGICDERDDARRQAREAALVSIARFNSMPTSHEFAIDPIMAARMTAITAQRKAALAAKRRVDTDLVLDSYLRNHIQSCVDEGWTFDAKGYGQFEGERFEPVDDWNQAAWKYYQSLKGANAG